MITGIALGALMGLILALTGAGGGILAVPALVFGMGMSMAEAAPVGLLAVGLAAGVGAVLGLRQGIVRYKAALFMAAIGMASAPLGLHLARQVANAPLALAFAAVLVLVALRTLGKAHRQLRGEVAAPAPALLPCVLNPTKGRLRWTLPCARALAFTGFASGLLSGLLGVGGGFVIVPALTRYTNLPGNSVVATSLAIIALVSTATVSTAAATGALHWAAAIPFAGGALLGLLLGRQIAERLAGPRLQQLFALAALAAAALLAAHALGGH